LKVTSWPGKMLENMGNISHPIRKLEPPNVGCYKKRIGDYVPRAHGAGRGRGRIGKIFDIWAGARSQEPVARMGGRKRFDATA
jgi:hypothetical protein